MQNLQARLSKTLQMNAIQLAQMLDNRQYGDETTPEITKAAMENGLVIVFGYSDDNCEFEGAIHEEIPCWEGCKIYFDKGGTNFTNESGECFLTYHKDKEAPERNMIHAVWCDKNILHGATGKYYAWTYHTDIPHEAFDIMEDDRPFCRGIVFSINDLQ